MGRVRHVLVDPEAPVPADLTGSRIVSPKGAGGALTLSLDAAMISEHPPLPPPGGGGGVAAPPRYTSLG